MASEFIAKVTSKLTSKPARIGTAVVLILLGLFCLLDNQRVGDLTFYNTINDRAMELIDETLERDQTTFLIITAIKASLAMIEGSTVGVGFQLQVGDIVQPAYDYVDFFWRAFLYAFMIMGFYKILLETDLLLLGISFMGIGLILIGVSFGPKLPQFDTRLWGRRCLLFGMLFAYIAPLSLLLTHELSERYTEEIREHHYETIQAFDKQLDISALQFLALKNQISILQPTKSLEVLKNSMLRVVNQIRETFRLSLMAFMFYVLVILFELLFFPILSAVILYKFAQFALGRILLPASVANVVPPAPPAETPATA